MNQSLITASFPEKEPGCGIFNLYPAPEKLRDFVFRIRMKFSAGQVMEAIKTHKLFLCNQFFSAGDTEAGVKQIKEITD
jgi:hypothetical protein